MESLLSGVGFGIALTTAGLAKLAVVGTQMKLQDWYLTQAFLSATVFTSVVYSLLNRGGFAKLQPRSSSPLGLFGNYDGNVLGGALLGLGMAMSSSGPEIVIAQVASGAHHALYVLGGAVLGGLIWTGSVADVVRSRKEAAGVKPQTTTLDEAVGLSRRTTLVLLGTAWVFTMFGPWTGHRGSQASGAFGGLLIGLSQLLSMLLRRSMIGISGSYEEIGNHFWWIVKGTNSGTKPRSRQNIIFAIGVMIGAAVMSRLGPRPTDDGGAHDVSFLSAIIGGALMIIGSRMAGGCTAGHGLSGLALLSTSSLVTMLSALTIGPLSTLLM